MNPLHHKAYNFIVYKDYKTSLKFVFPICSINFKAQRLSCSLINHHIIIHHNIFLKSLPCEFPNRIIDQSLIIHMLINDLLFSKLIQTCHTSGVSEPELISLYPLMVSLISSSSSSFIFMQFRRGIFNFFASSNRDVLFIYL